MQPQASVLDQVITLLEQRLAEARAGKLTGIGVVTHFQEGRIQVDTRGDVAAIAIGAAQMQRQMLDTMFPPQNVVSSVGKPS